MNSIERNFWLRNDGLRDPSQHLSRNTSVQRRPVYEHRQIGARKAFLVSGLSRTVTIRSTAQAACYEFVQQKPRQLLLVVAHNSAVMKQIAGDVAQSHTVQFIK